MSENNDGSFWIDDVAVAVIIAVVMLTLLGGCWIERHYDLREREIDAKIEAKEYVGGLPTSSSGGE